jgi:CheY-like chemotaxis protein
MMKRVLHIDDSQMALRMMERMLKDCAEVLSATTIHDAQAVLAKGPVDLIITDYMLDDGNGVEFVQKLRTDEQYKEIPILLVSTGLTDDLAYHAMRSGINQSFRKPLHPSEVRQAVLKQLESPWVEDVHRTRLLLHGVSWQAGGMYYEYSPDLDRRVSADRKEEAHEEMTRQLKALVGGRMNFEEVPDLRIVDYRLDVE